MSRKPLADSDFSRLIDDLRTETDDSERKLAKLYYSHGIFSGSQAAALVGCFKTAPEKMRVLRMLEQRLCRMSCSEGKEVLRNLQLPQRDKLGGLDYIKRTLYDHQTMEGAEHIFKAFIPEKDKLRALKQLTEISSYADGAIPAGGHMESMPNGTVRSAGIPRGEHQLGPVKVQLHQRYGRADLHNFPITYRTRARSMHLCHPSYDYGHRLDASYYANGGRPPLPPRPIDTAVTGPARPLATYLCGRARTEETRPCYAYGDPCLGSEQSGVSSIGFIDHQKVEHSKCC